MMRFRTIAPEERIEALQVAKMQRLNCYHQIVKRLTDGESARSVARWACTLHVEGPAGQWSEREWQKHLWPLRKQILEAKNRILTLQSQGHHKMPTTKPAPEAVAAQVEVQVDKLSFMDRIPPSARRVFEHVEAAFDDINSERGLKYLFFVQMERLSQLRELEGQLKTLLPNGDKTVDTMAGVLEKLLKLELGKKWCRGKFGEMPVIDVQQPVSEIAKGMAQFDEVDRNLMREAGVTIIDMLSEVSGGKYKIGRPGADAPGKVSAEERDSKPAAGPDVP